MKTQKILGEVIVTRSSNQHGRATFEAYEVDRPSPGMPFHSHSSITSGTSGVVEGPAYWYGTIASRCLPTELDALPYGIERTFKVAVWQAEQYEAAYTAIIQAYPEAAEGDRSMGRIRFRSH